MSRYKAAAMRIVSMGVIVCLCAALSVSAAAAPGKRSAGKERGLASPDPEVAAAAATALGNSRGSAAAEELLDALAMGMHPKAAIAALGALAGLRKGSHDTVSLYLDHRTPKVRAAALETMATLPDARVTGHVLAALGDGSPRVRAVAAGIAADKKLKEARETLLSLVLKGDEAAARALGALADLKIAKTLGEKIGQAPDALVALALGTTLRRPDFKSDEARIEIVRILGKVPGDASISELEKYLEAVPEKSERKSRSEAAHIVEQRGGVSGAAQKKADES